VLIVLQVSIFSSHLKQSSIISCKMRTHVLYSFHEGVEGHKKDGDQVQHGLAYVESRSTTWLPTVHWHGWLIDPPELRSTHMRPVAVYARVTPVTIIASCCAWCYGGGQATCKTQQVLAALQQNGSLGEPEASYNP
jgi:hypothetical protein